jgi:hypothetical protein
MTDMSIRVRGRLQDGMINWQETRYRKSEERQQHADIRRSRMTCSADLPNIRQTQDWTGNMTMNPSGRFRVIEEQRPKVRVISGDGIRWNAALTILVLVSVILCGILLTDLAAMGNSGRMITRLGSRIQAIGDKNVDLKTELEMSTDSATVCTGAVRMDLISSNGAQTIRLTAPQNARFTLTSASAAAENADLEMRMMSYAGD